MTHVFHDEIQALLRGEKLQFDYASGGDGWEDLDPELHDHAASHLLSGRKTTYQFQLKPRSVKIGSREVEAPVLEPVEGQTLWYWDNYHDGPCDGKPSKEEASNGEWFASSDAARAAYAAYTALLRGESC